MKLYISILLIFSHLLATVGFNLRVHECGGKKSYALYEIPLGTACSCNHENEAHRDNDDCCKDKKVLVKADNQSNVTIKVILVKSTIDAFMLPAKCFFAQHEKALISQPKPLAHCTESPPGHSPPLYILYDVFLI